MSHLRVASERLSGEEIQTVTLSTFDELVLNGEGPIAVEFMSYSCEYCRAMEPVLEQVAEMVKLKEKIFKVNIATEPELGERYDVQGSPTLLMFLSGKRVGQVEGPPATVSSVLTAVSQPFRSMR